jgi:hypothetical protein
VSPVGCAVGTDRFKTSRRRADGRFPAAAAGVSSPAPLPRSVQLVACAAASMSRTHAPTGRASFPCIAGAPAASARRRGRRRVGGRSPDLGSVRLQHSSIRPALDVFGADQPHTGEASPRGNHRRPHRACNHPSDRFRRKCAEELEAPVGPLPAPSRMVSPTRLSAGACSTNEALLPLR